MTTPRPTFYRLRVLVRPEIVTLETLDSGLPMGRGIYRTEDWNELIFDPDVEVIDAAERLRSRDWHL